MIEKIKQYKKLKEELKEEYGYFSEICLVDEYNDEMEERDGKHYQDTSGCCQSEPIVLCIKG